MRIRDRHLPISLLIALAAVLGWSWTGAYDRPTWWLEAFPVFLALPVLLYTASGFPLTRLAYGLIFVHMAILLVGAHYTYERVPPFNWLRDHFGLSRNHYDRLGHLAQGFVPALVAREVLIRRQVVSSAGWRNFLTVCFCLAVSACYELLEWSTSVMLGGGAEKFLGTQGDPFDTQKDMLCALIGAVAALLLLPRWHDRELRRTAALPA